LSKLDRLIDTFIEATEEKRMNWCEALCDEQIKENIGGNDCYGVFKVDAFNSAEDIFIIKYATNTNEEALFNQTILGIPEKNKPMDKVKLVIINIMTMQIITGVDETDIENPHRLWTLFKLADRNAKGVDIVIDNLIDKYTKFEF